MKFCPRCGQGLIGSGSHEQRIRVSEAGAPIQKRSWFERHLNWTMVFAWVGALLVTPFVWVAMEMIAPQSMSEGSTAIAQIVVVYAVSIGVGSWVLRKKNRSMWWLLLCGGVWFLFVSNKSTIAQHDEAIKSEPGNADGYLRRGDAYADMGEYRRAAGDYDTAIRLDPRLALAYFNRAYAYGEMGQYDKAIADYTKAIELDPADAQAYHNRGLDYINKGEASCAISDLEKAMELSSDPELTEDAQQALQEIRDAS